MPDLYYTPRAAPCRSCLLTAKAVGINLNLKEVETLKGEQMKPELLSVNPQHCVPTLVDGDFVLWESRAICTYLASKYGKDDTLYPTDFKTRAKIDRLLYFDMGTLFHRFGELVHPVLFSGEEPCPKKLEKLQEAISWLDKFLTGHPYAVGDNITVADHVLVATVSTLEAANVDLGKHTNVSAWLARCKASMVGYDEANEPGILEFKEITKDKLNLG